MLKRRRLLRTGTLVAVLLAAIALALAWAPDRSAESLAPRWAPPPSQFLAMDGMRVHLRDEGSRQDAEPIVLLHGTSSSLHTWDGWVGPLAVDRRVIRVDLPGFGLTGPHPAGRYDVEAYTEFVIHLMDKLAIRRAMIVGNSLGGYVAWKTAHDYPARVSKLILLDSVGYAYEPDAVPIGFRLARSPVFSRLVSHVLPRSTVASSLRNVYGNPERVDDELVERYFQLTLREGNRRAVVQRFQQMQPGVHASQIPDVRQPTLILWGARDRLIPLRFGERFARELPDARLVVFDGLGHMPQEEDPAATVSVASAFLKQGP